MPQSQVLEITPSNEIRFTGPYTEVAKSMLTLRNPAARKMAFKVKTTAPKQYCVRPKSGFIEAGDACDITVMLQPFNDGTPTAEISKRKFLVQACYVSQDENDIDKIWKSVPVEKMMESKLRVVFDASVDVAKQLSMTMESVTDDNAKYEMETRRLTEQVEQLRSENEKLMKMNQELTAVRSLIDADKHNGETTADETKACRLAEQVEQLRNENAELTKMNRELAMARSSTDVGVQNGGTNADEMEACRLAEQLEQLRNENAELVKMNHELAAARSPKDTSMHGGGMSVGEMEFKMWQLAVAVALSFLIGTFFGEIFM